MKIVSHEQIGYVHSTHCKADSADTTVVILEDSYRHEVEFRLYDQGFGIMARPDEKIKLFTEKAELTDERRINCAKAFVELIENLK